MAGQDKDKPCGEAPQRACGNPLSGADGPRAKLHSFNWLADIPGGYADSDIVEVTFKNTRKGYYRNSTHIPLEIGDIVAVEAQPGHDIGTVTLTGLLAERRMRRPSGERRGRGERAGDTEVRRVFRKARPGDLERFEEARARETDTMVRSRQIAARLGLNMKIGDVEYQGDGNKAIFYYIADERVDFRQLIKVLADTFKVRIEMKQIGARQEAGRIGGIGPCGRPLCCSSWMTNFVSVATSAARFQDLSLNPQKLAGQCAKLKCCLNFEVDTYVEASRGMPPKDARLETADATYFHFKSDIFRREVTYSTEKGMAANLVTIPVDRVFEVIALNKQGEKPLSLLPEGSEVPKEKKAFGDILGDEELTRFDKKKKRRRKADKPRGESKGGGKGSEGKGDKSGDKPAAGPRPESKPRPESRPGESKPGESKPGESKARPEGGERERRRKSRPGDRRKGGEGKGGDTTPAKPKGEQQS